MKKSVKKVKSTYKNYLRQQRNTINYLDKMKIEIKTKKILYTSDSFYKQNYMPSCSYYEAYYKDYQKIIIARLKNMVYLKLVPGALAPYKNKIKYCINKMVLSRLHLDMLLHRFLQRDGWIGITPKIEFATFVDLLKYANIKTLTINLKDHHYLFDEYKLEYIQRLQYLRQYIQKYCNDVQIIVHFSGTNYKCDFWKIDNCIKTCDCRKTYVALEDVKCKIYLKLNLGVIINKNYVIMNNEQCHSCKILRYIRINKTNSIFHRNFKLEERQN